VSLCACETKNMFLVKFTLSDAESTLMEIQGRGSIVVRLLVKVKACLLKNSLAHTLEAWRSSRVNVDKHIILGDDIYI
jgi:hypothetical protein